MVDPTPLDLAATAWFAVPADTACGDVPGASVTQAVVTPTQEIILAGSFLGAADFGDGPLPYLNSNQVFLAAFKANGQPKWSRALPGNTAAIAVDAQGNVALLRTWIAALNDVGGAGTVDSYGPDGTLHWTHEIPFGPSSERRGLAIAAAGTGNLSVAVPGRLLTLDAGGQVVQEQDYAYVAPVGLGLGANANPADAVRLLGGIASVAYDPLRLSAFVAAVDSVGQESWRLPVTTPDADGALQNLHTGTSAGIAISGLFYDQVTIGAAVVRGRGAAPAAANAAVTPDKSGAFLALIDAQGKVAWARETYAAGLGAPQSIAFDDNAKMIVAATSATDATLTISALDCRGERTWAQAFSGFADAQVIAAPVPGTTDIVLAGSTDTRYQPACETCCYAPHPYLVRIARDGTPTPGFLAHK